MLKLTITTHYKTNSDIIYIITINMPRSLLLCHTLYSYDTLTIIFSAIQHLLYHKSHCYIIWIKTEIISFYSNLSSCFQTCIWVLLWSSQL